MVLRIRGHTTIIITLPIRIIIFGQTGGTAGRMYVTRPTILQFWPLIRMAYQQWSSIIAKEQFDDQSDDLLSYQMVITGGQAHFLFNNLEKKANLLNDFSVQPDGKISRNPTLKNLDRGYELMPKFAKQVSAKQVIIPCIHRNYICFAKLEYN